MKIRRDEDIVRLNAEVEKVYSRTVTPVGTGAKIDFLKRFRGYEVLVVVLKGAKKNG